MWAAPSGRIPTFDFQKFRKQKTLMAISSFNSIIFDENDLKKNYKIYFKNMIKIFLKD